MLFDDAIILITTANIIIIATIANGIIVGDNTQNQDQLITSVSLSTINISVRICVNDNDIDLFVSIVVSSIVFKKKGG